MRLSVSNELFFLRSPLNPSFPAINWISEINWTEFGLLFSHYRAASAIVAQRLTLLAEMLRVHLALVGHIQTIGFFQRPLLVRIHVDVTLDALLAHIGPAVARHPFALALGTLVFAKAPLLALVRRQALALRSCLRAILDVVPFLEAQMTQIR